MIRDDEGKLIRVCPGCLTDDESKFYIKSGYEITKYATDCFICGVVERDTVSGEFLTWKKDRKSDPVNHPAHYNQGKIEVAEFIEDKKLGWHLGNATKYICRAGLKDPNKFVQDLEKAIWYIRRKIEVQSKNPRRPNDMNDKPNE